MMNKFKASITGEKIAVAGLILIGILLRLRQYLTGRSLWSDEAMLASSIVTRNFGGLFEPLEYGQGSPIGFLLVEKIFSLPFGRSEYALRFFPLILGIGSIWLFYLLLKRTTRGAGLLTALALFCLNPRLIYYSSEVKQYIADVFFTLVLLLLVCRLFQEQPEKRDFLWMEIGGVIALWFSHPALFVLPAIGLSLAIFYLRERDYSSLRNSVGIGVLWLATVVLLYFLVLKNIQHNDYMFDYWQGAFMPLAPGNAIDWFRGTMGTIIATQFGIAYITTFAFLLFFIGWMILWRQNWYYAAAFVLIFLVTLTASAAKLYPFAERMILFLIPIGLLLLGKTVEGLHQSLQRHRALSGIAAVILAGSLIYGPLATSTQYFFQPKYYEHIRPFMEFLHEAWRPGDAMYISNGAAAQFEYYAPVYNLDGVTYKSNGRDVYKQPNDILGQLSELKGQSRVWILISHVYEKDDFNEKDFILNDLNQLGEKKREFRVPGTSVYLYLYDLAK